MKLKAKVVLAPFQYLNIPVKLLVLSAMMYAMEKELNPSEMKVYAYQTAQETQLEFRPTQGLNGRAAGGARFTLQVYESSDGIAVSSRLDRFRSAGRANKELMRIIRKGKVIERGQKLDATGRPMGERVVVGFTSNNSSKAYSVVLWTDKTELHRIQSSSLCHVLQFEKQFYP